MEATAERDELTVEVTRSELTLAQAAEWLRQNRWTGEALLHDPGGAVIGAMIRGTGWRLVQTCDQEGFTLLAASRATPS